jgi:hypothetical protein
MVVHTCNPSTWEAEAEDLEFKASLGYRVKPYLKKPKENKLCQRRVRKHEAGTPPSTNNPFHV